jgi:hypothetical protein
MESKEQFDDFLDKADRKKLIQFLTKLYNNNHQWMDDLLVKCCVKEHYKSVVQNMDKEMYFREKEEEDDYEALIDNVLDTNLEPKPEV